MIICSTCQAVGDLCLSTHAQPACLATCVVQQTETMACIMFGAGVSVTQAMAGLLQGYIHCMFVQTELPGIHARTPESLAHGQAHIIPCMRQLYSTLHACSIWRPASSSSRAPCKRRDAIADTSTAAGVRCMSVPLLQQCCPCFYLLNQQASMHSTKL